MYISELAPCTAAAPLRINAGRQGYLLCVEGDVHLNDGGSDYVMQRHDAAELKGPLLLEATAGTHGALLMLFEMELTQDSRGET